MATVSVTNSNNRIHDADTTTNWTSDGGGGAGPQLEPDLGYQRTSGSNYSVSRKVGTTKGGHALSTGAPTDMTAEANQVVMFKCVWYNSINAAPYPACGVRLGSSSSNFYEYSVIDDGQQGDLDPDPKRLVYIVVADPNVAAWPDQITGTPAINSVDFWGIQGDFGGSAKAENVAMDAVDVCRGVGVLWLVGGDGASADGEFADFIAHDEGTLANRFGHIATVRPGVLEVFGKLWVGRTETPTATATVFQDSALTVLFGAGFFGAGWTGLGFDLGGTGTDIDIGDIVFKGQGQSGHKVYFDTITEVDPTPDEVTLSPAPGFITGGPVVYSNEGGSDTIGLTSGNTYWLEYVTDTTFNVHSLRNNARTAATPIGLSDGATGEAHSFTRSPDIRPDLEIVGSTGTFDASGCTFESFRNITLTSAATFTSCIFRSCELVDMTTNDGGVLTLCMLTGQTTPAGTALVKTNTVVNITSNTFDLDAGSGHAIEIDTAGTYTFVGNTLTGYWSSPDNEKGAEFHTQDDVDAGTDTITSAEHGFSTGDEVYYNDNGGTDTIGLTDGNRYYVNAPTVDTFTLHRSKATAVAGTPAINLSDGSSGETHTFYSGNAAVVNTSSGLVTLQITGGTLPSVRNVGTSTTSIQASVNVIVAVKDSAGSLVDGAYVYVQDSAGPFNDYDHILRATTVSGVAQAAYQYPGSDVDVVLRVRRSSTGTTKYVPVDTAATIASTGMSATVTVQQDNIAAP